jgi:hypothetical protein
MSLEDFHRDFRIDLLDEINDRIESGEGEYPSEEAVFSDLVMRHIENAGITDTPTLVHWSGKVGQGHLRISGFALGLDESSLDLFVSKYLGSETISDLDTNSVISASSEGFRFLTAAASGSLERRVDPSHPVRDLVATIRSNWERLDSVRIFVLTDGRTSGRPFAAKEAHGKLVRIEVMDIERLFRHSEGKPRDELACSFNQYLGQALPCVHVPETDADYEYILTAIPGQVLRDLYSKYGARLLEANVRTFLGAQRKVNKGILQTLRTEPKHFLAYNNGLVLVCDEAQFERTVDGGLGLSYLKGFQIVNGGQTTSTLYFGSRDDRSLRLSDVRVPAKIIILKAADEEVRERLVSNVSRFANSQNTVKTSDLSANRPFHTQLEALADQTWCPDGFSRWFYERAAGAYSVMLLRDGTTPAKRRRIKESIPPKRKLTKNDVAKYHEAWRGLPHQVALAGEKNFAAFMAALDDDNQTVVPDPLTHEWFRHLIAKVIIFRTIESRIKSKEVRHHFAQGWVNISTYVTALVGTRVGHEINLERVWSNQAASARLSDLLFDWAVLVNKEFNRIAPGQQFSEVAKRAQTWERIQQIEVPSPSPEIPEFSSKSLK